jgi:hypothetical protein
MQIYRRKKVNLKRAIYHQMQNINSQGFFKSMHNFIKRQLEKDVFDTN